MRIKLILCAALLAVLPSCAGVDVKPVIRTGGRILLQAGEKKLAELAVTAKEADKAKLETVAELLGIARGWLIAGKIDEATGSEALSQAILLLKEAIK